MNKKIVIGICVAVMLIPTVLAIVLYKKKPPEIVKDPEGVSLVIITDSLSNTYEIEDKDEIKFLTDLANGSEVSCIPDAVYGYKKFDLKFTRGETAANYRFYMSVESPDEVYYNDEEDKCFKADSLISRDFMEKAYAVSLYDTAAPSLTVGDTGTVISPLEMTWNYSTVNGKYSPVSVPTSDEVKNIEKISKETLGINFSRKPSSTVVSVSENGEQLYSKLIEEFSGISTKEAKYYKIQIHAKWNKEDDQSSYGEATYQFNAYILPDAEFSFSATDIQQGGVIAITIKNASAGGSMTVECTPELKDLPVFFSVGDSAVAFLPTSYETEPGDYTLKLNYDGVIHEQNITVREVKYNSKTYSDKADVINSVFSDENLASEDAIKESVFKSESASGLLCAGEKPKVPTKRSDHKTGYGLYVTFKATDGKARHDGIDYDVAKGSDVKAILSGTVVYVGTSPIHGGTIVIDHGNGARSWYCRVDTSSVTVGQAVKQGDVIAKSDDSGFGDASRAHLGFSIGKTFVSPTWIIEKGLPN